MEYHFDHEIIPKFVKERGLSIRQVRIALGMTNVNAINNWMQGKDIRVSHLINFCNKFHVPLDKFFYSEEKGKESFTPNDVTETDSTKPESVAILELKLQHQKEIAELKQQHLVELNNREIEMLRNGMAYERNVQQAFHEKNEAICAKLEEKLETKYEQKLAEKERIIDTLRQQLTELTVQFRDLEYEVEEKKNYMKSVALADIESGSYARIDKKQIIVIKHEYQKWLMLVVSRTDRNKLRELN